MMKHRITIVLLIGFIGLIGCKKNEKIDPPIENCAQEGFFSEYSARNFSMGFTTWSYGPNIEDVDNTYQFINDNTDIYAEHIDNKIPWNAWINDLPLPLEFSNEIAGRVARKISGKQLLLSVSLLNSSRDDLAEDFDGTIPNYIQLNDSSIEEAYFKHISYLLSEFSPDYLLITIEANELRLNAESKWEGYKLLIQNVKERVKFLYPDLQISESISLHNLFEVETTNPDEYIDEMVNYMNQMDFVAISYYPYFKNQHTKLQFQLAFDFLHDRITKPIAFSETANIAEDLSVASFNLFIEGNECEQNAYLESLLVNAQEQNYKFIIWWAHRDFDALWEVFPEEVKDVGKLWRDTGLLDENGKNRKSIKTWQKVLLK